MEENKNHIFGVFVSVSMPSKYSLPELNENELIIAEAKVDGNGKSVRDFLWGDQGIDVEFKKTDYHNYGKDMKLILFKFYLNPDSELKYIEEIESYSKKEKAIGIPIIIWMDDFLKLTDKAKYVFLQNIFTEKMNLLEAVVKKKKLDTNMPKLRIDLDMILDYHIKNSID